MSVGALADNNCTSMLICFLCMNRIYNVIFFLFLFPFFKFSFSVCCHLLSIIIPVFFFFFLPAFEVCKFLPANAFLCFLFSFLLLMCNNFSVYFWHFSYFLFFSVYLQNFSIFLWIFFFFFYKYLPTNIFLFY